MVETIDTVTVTVVTATTKTFEIEVHELAETSPGHGDDFGHYDLRSLAIDLAEKLDIDADCEVSMVVDHDAADMFIASANHLAARED